MERQVSRDFYGYYRISQGTKSRHKKERQQQLKNKIEIQGTGYSGEALVKKVDIREAPKTNVIVQLPQPQIISESEFTEGSLGATVKVAHESKEKLSRFCKKYGYKTVKLNSEPIQVEQFLRVLAKIGHSYASAEYGIDNFHPTLLPIINGQSNNLLKYVGSKALDQPQSKRALEMALIKKGELSYIVVYISLHFFPRMPQYKVVSGYL
jgi:hypothetical protein